MNKLCSLVHPGGNAIWSTKISVNFSPAVSGGTIYKIMPLPLQYERALIVNKPYLTEHKTLN